MTQQTHITNRLRQTIEAGHPDFPASLAQMPDAPGRIHVLGDAGLLHTAGIAIVGARKATPYGLSTAKRFARQATLSALTVVSGGAIGCDQAAHNGCLEAGGRTIVVLGCGADVVYSKRAGKLFEEVLAAGGAMVSEAPWGAPPTKWGFTRRNRIIAGLARATLIVEAGLPSGTFQTADATLNQGKEVMAVPGSINSAESRGSNLLIAQGATPIIDDRSFDDALLSIYGLTPDDQTASGPQAANTASTLHVDPGWQAETIKALQASTLRAERLVGICGEDLVEVIRNLSRLEMKGAVQRLRDGSYACNINP